MEYGDETMQEMYLLTIGFWLCLYLANFVAGFQMESERTRKILVLSAVFNIIAILILIVELDSSGWTIVSPKNIGEVVGAIVFLFLFFSSALGLGYLMGKRDKESREIKKLNVPSEE